MSRARRSRDAFAARPRVDGCRRRERWCPPRCPGGHQQGAVAHSRHGELGAPRRGRCQRLTARPVPEILEVEAARALIAARALNRRITAVHAPDTWFLKRGLTPPAVRSAL